MTTLYRFTIADGLVQLIHPNSSVSLHVEAIHHHQLNGQATIPPAFTVVKDLLAFDQLVCDFDETITDHDTTCSFDTLASQVRPDHFADPQMTWPEILQAYLDDLEKVNVSDLCHLNNAPSSSLPPPGTTDNGLYHPQPQPTHRLLDPKIRELKCHIDGRTFTPEPELPVPKVPSLQPWIHSQVRKRAVEKVSLDRVFESGNLVGLTKSQIRDYGRHQIRLRPGVVDLLRAFVQEQDRREKASTEGSGVGPQGAKELRGQRRGELWIVSVNWSEDLIRGAMDQVFGSEEATERYLPDSNLTSSNLEFKEEGHEMLSRRMKTANCNVRSKDKESDAGTEEHLSNGEVRVRCLTGTDKLHAFQKIQRDYATRHGLALTDTKWAYLGDSSTDLGCLVEADVGIIVGKSKSLLTDCERSGIQVIDLVLKDTQ